MLKEVLSMLLMYGVMVLSLYLAYRVGYRDGSESKEKEKNSETTNKGGKS